MQKKKDRTPLAKTPLPPETRVVNGLLALLKKNQASMLEKNPTMVEQAALAEFQVLLPKVVSEWQQQELKRSLTDPLQAAIQQRQPERVLEVFVRSTRAMSLLQQMHAHWMQENPSAETAPKSDVQVKDTASTTDIARTS